MKKEMKKITFLLITLFATGTMLMAQGGQRGGQRNMDPKDRAERMTERMAKEYSLNDTQKKEVYNVNLAMAEKMQSSKAAHRVDKNKEGRKDAKLKDKKEAGKDKAVAKKDRKDHGKRRHMGEKPSKEDRQKMMAEMKRSRDDYNAKIKNIFTKEQYDAYTKKKEEHQKRMNDRRQRPERTNS